MKKKARSIEADANGKPLGTRKNKRVQASGRLAWRHGVERADYPVLEIVAIER